MRRATSYAWIVGLGLGLGLGLEWRAGAQEPPPGFPGKDPFAQKADENDVNVGPLGIGATVDEKGENVLARAVHKDGPAEKAGLKPGEQLTGVEGRAFEPKADPVLAIVSACERAEAAAPPKKDATVTLLVRRGGADVPVKVAFPSRGKHSSSCPKKCEKCKKIVDLGVAWLVSQQKGDGSWPTDMGSNHQAIVSVTSLAGLALMAAGGPDDAITKAGELVLAKAGAPDDSPFGKSGFPSMPGLGKGTNMNQVHWELAYGLVFLDEFHRRTKRADVKAKIEEIVKTLEKNREASGGWGHGPGGPNPLGYVELEIMSNQVLLGFAGAKKAGVALDKPGLEKAFSFIEATTKGDGGVGYSPNEGQKGYGEAGRTSGAIAAFALLGQQKTPFYEKMVEFYRKNMKTLASGHVSPCMHLLTGAFASWILGPKDWQEYVETYRTTIIANQQLDGSFAATPTHESKALHSNTDRGVGLSWTTATYVLILALPGEKVWLTTEKPAPEKTVTGGGK